MSTPNMNSAGTGSAADVVKSGFGVSLTRLAAVFYAPVEMFKDMARRFGWTDWLTPILVGIVVSVVVGFLVFPSLDLETGTREQLEAAGLSGEQVEQRIDAQKQFLEGPLGKVVMLSNIVVYPLTIMLLALIFWGGAAAMGAGIKYSRVVALMAYAWLPRLLEGALLVFVLQGRDPVRQDRLSGVLATNPASYLDVSQAGTPLYALMGALNPFTLWAMVLVALGLAGIGRLARGTAMTVVFGLYAVWVVILMGWAAIF